MNAALLVLMLAQSPDAGSSKGKLSNEELFTVINRGRAQVRGCYDQAIELVGCPRMNELDWKVVASWTIDIDGKVSNVNVQNSSQTTSLTNCIRDVVLRWRFPKPRGGSVEVTLPWLPKIACDE